jgi:hypothetical protein
MADWIENLGVGLSYEELQQKAAIRVAELQSKWRRRSGAEFRDEYDLVKRVRLAWQIREEIRNNLTQKELAQAQEPLPLSALGRGAYSMFFSRNIGSEQADDIYATVVDICKKLDIQVIGSGGGMDPSYTDSIFHDVAMKIRSCETLLAIVTRRSEDESNIWIVSEVAMALALAMPVALVIDENAKSEQWERLGRRYREFRFNSANRNEKIKEAIIELDAWLLNKLKMQQA